MEGIQKLKRIAVFCGSRDGNDPAYKEDAYEIGQQLLHHQLGLVYGGSSAGLMGVVSDAVMAGDGEVIGVIPKLLVKQERAQQHLTDLRVVETMHERKAQMYELSAGFIALPGGIGTLEELAEVLTWSAIGQHAKKLGLMNTNGYYDPLLRLFDHMVEAQFLLPEIRENIVVSNNPKELVEMMMRE